MDSAVTASYLRVASLSIAIFDFVQTLPAVWQLYADQYKTGRFTISCVLMALIQFTSILVMTISNVGWFAHFTQEACLKFWAVPLAFKVCQVMVSQAIIGIRAFSLSRRSTRIGWLLLIFYVCSCTLQWFTTMYQREVGGNSKSGSCLAVSSNPAMGAWVYYLIAILYDTVVTVMSLGYLLKYKSSNPSSAVVVRLTRMVVYDGLGYLAMLTASNVINLMLYLWYEQREDVQSAAVSVGYALTWIMSQRLLTHLHGVYTESRSHNVTPITPTPIASFPHFTSTGPHTDYLRRPTATYHGHCHHSLCLAACNTTTASRAGRQGV